MDHWGGILRHQQFCPVSLEFLSFLWTIPAIAATGSSKFFFRLLFCVLTLIVYVKRSLQQLERPFVN